MILKTDRPEQAIELLKSIYDVDAVTAEGGIDVGVAVHPDFGEWVQREWPDIFTHSAETDEGDLDTLS